MTAGPGAAGDGPARHVVLVCPDWPVVAALAAVEGASRADALAAEVPAAVVHANRIVAVTPGAEAEGVTVGQRRREAQRACPALVLHPHDPGRDARAFEPVVRALVGITPRVEVTRPGWCTFGARGPSRYHGGDEGLAAAVARVLAGVLPASARRGVGIADGRFAAAIAALGVARVPASSPAVGGPGSAAGSGPAGGFDWSVVPPGGSARFLAPLPVGLLSAVDGPEPARRTGEAADQRDLIELFGRLGLRTLGHVAALPAGDVVARFGPLGQRAHRRAGGLDDEPPRLASPPAEWAVTVELDPPVAQVGPVAFAVRPVAEAVVERLRLQGLVCAEVVVQAESDHGERHERAWRRDGGFTAAAIVERVRWQLEGWGAAGAAGPTAGISLVRLVPTEVVADVGRQAGFWGGRADGDERARRGVARLVGLLGPDAVLVPERRGGRDPDQAVVLVPAVTVELAPARREPTSVGAGPWPGAIPGPAPARLDVRPHPAELLDERGQPVAVTGRGFLSAPPVAWAVDGRPPIVVTDHAGPWLLDERWWDPGRQRRRARLQLVLADGTACLAVREQGRWWRVATYD